MVVCTGRTLVITSAQVSFGACSAGQCLGHLWPLQICETHLLKQESEHFPLELQLLLQVAASPAPLPPPHLGIETTTSQGHAAALLSGPYQARFIDCTAAVTAHQHSPAAAGYLCSY